MKGYQSKVYRPIKLGKVQVKFVNSGIEVSLAGQSKYFCIPEFMNFEVLEGYLHLGSKEIDKDLTKAKKSMCGTLASLINSYVIGLEKGHSKSNDTTSEVEEDFEINSLKSFQIEE